MTLSSKLNVAGGELGRSKILETIQAQPAIYKAVHELFCKSVKIDQLAKQLMDSLGNLRHVGLMCPN
jgi:hypothetical protein